GARAEIPGHVCQPIQGRRARLRRRGDPSGGYAAAALPRAADAAEQATGRAAAQAREHSALKRDLTLVDAIGIGVNGIVGSGIYLLVAPLARVGGGSSVFGVLGCGALCVLIALCFAELSSMYDRSGGPYVYAREAFGPHVGFAVGWLGMATGVLGLSAVAVGFAGASLLYALLQLAALGALPDAAAREQPLPDVAARALGAWGAPLLGVTALLSMLGFCAGVALVAPRYFMALADDGQLPARLRDL